MVPVGCADDVENAWGLGSLCHAPVRDEGLCVVEPGDLNGWRPRLLTTAALQGMGTCARFI